MRIGISNLAWEARHDDAVADLLRRHAVDSIDLAPGRYFDDPTRASFGEVEAIRRWWAERGVTVLGLQALLFGSQGMNLFGHDAERAAMLDRLDAVTRIGETLGARFAVFGSPKQRDRGGRTDAEAAAIAVPFFRRVGDLAASRGITLCLEPNPPRYGANFMTSAAETAAVVRAVDHPAVRLQCDLGALHLAGEDLSTGLDDWQSLVAHAHLSEPDLRLLGTAGTPHAEWAPTLRERLRHCVACIEMLPPDAIDPVPGIEAAMRLASMHYRDGGTK